MTDLVTFCVNFGPREREPYQMVGYIINNRFIVKSYQVHNNSFSYTYSANHDVNMTLEDHLRNYISKTGGSRSATNIEYCKNNIGKYYERIYRKGLNLQIGNEVEKFKNFDSQILTQSIINCKILIGKLNQLFEIVSFNKENFDVFGHEIRNVLLLSSMEVEAGWNGILSSNNYSSGRNTTKDYVKLNTPLNLNNYKVIFKLYPNIEPIVPFENWVNLNPTTSLFWYDNYNKTKHDRENNERLGTLFSTVNSVSAVIILLFAQFGPDHSFWHQSEFSDIQVIPPIQNLKDYYIPKNPQGAYEWQRDNYVF